jgi:hypothetical protein
VRRTAGKHPSGHHWPTWAGLIAVLLAAGVSALLSHGPVQLVFVTLFGVGGPVAVLVLETKAHRAAATAEGARVRPGRAALNGTRPRPSLSSVSVAREDAEAPVPQRTDSTRREFDRHSYEEHPPAEVEELATAI